MECCLIEDGHRYYLIKDLNINNGHKLIIIQKNPSTANGNRSDPTAGKVIKWAKEHNFGKVIFLNLFSYIASNATMINNNNFQNIKNKKTDDWLSMLIKNNPNAIIVAAWGNNPKYLDKSKYDDRINEVVELVGKDNLHLVGSITKRRYPKHGLSWNKKPELYDYSKFL